MNTSREGGASLNILSGLVSGNFGSFWTGFVFFLLMLLAYVAASQFGMNDIFGQYYSIFAFGLVAFGMLGMGPVTIAVDSYGPVTDNAQSVYELSLIEDDKQHATEEIERDFGFKPDFDKAKYYLEANDGAGNTFKATAKPVLIGTAVAGEGAPRFRVRQILDGLYGRFAASWDEIPTLPRTLRQSLAGKFADLSGTLAIEEVAEEAASGTRKTLGRLSDGELVETVSIDDFCKDKRTKSKDKYKYNSRTSWLSDGFSAFNRKRSSLITRQLVHK